MVDEENTSMRTHSLFATKKTLNLLQENGLAKAMERTGPDRTGQVEQMVRMLKTCNLVGNKK